MNQREVDEALDWIAETLTSSGLMWSDRWRPGLSTLMRWTHRFSRSTNLVGDASPLGLAKEHILEALTVASMLSEVAPQWSSVVDVGAGAGLEGVCLALTSPGARLVAVEPRRRRADFIEVMADAVGCRVKVQRSTLEAWREPERFDVAVSRATFAPSRWLELSGQLVAPNGWVVAHGDASLEELDPAALVVSVPGPAGHFLAFIKADVT